MKAFLKALLFSLLPMVSAVDPTLAQPAAGAAATPALQFAQQGWTAGNRETFYTTSQGSRMIPYPWFKALRRLDADAPFAGDQLARYGYLANDKSAKNPEGLPVGFVIDGDTKTGFLGMTCAACHTSEIEYQKAGVTQRLRIDGAPATANFQLFLTDLEAAAKATIADNNRLAQFAQSVLGASPSPAKVATLKTDFGAWVKQFSAFMDASLPASSPWGPGRLDAFGMIFNRVAARDLGIDANFKVADAPVSYPFLWNASRQDKTQWNGGVPNGLFIHALSRNTGEVFGVFADFSPKKLTDTPRLIDYGKNSVKFSGLQQLEEKIAVLQAPPWPFGELKQDLVDRGRVKFAEKCGGCHEEKILPHGTWLTPVQAVGTDPRMFLNAERSSQSGMLAGALSPNPPGSRLADPALTSNILATAVVGALLNEAFSLPPKLNSGVLQAIKKDLHDLAPDSQNKPLALLLLQPSTRDNLKTHIEQRLSQMFRPPAPGGPPAYEARVLHGIWATAPYLHNGSVPNLWELLLPANQRSTSFMVGNKMYDVKNVGYVTDSSPFKDGKLVVGAGAEPGNSNAGHEFGADLSEDDRWALIEYLKQL
jgi:hypothetical protein